MQQSSEVRQVENCPENQNKYIGMDREVIKHSVFLRRFP